MKAKYTVLSLLLFLLLAGIGAAQEKALLPAAKDVGPGAVASVQPSSNTKDLYCLQPGDTIEIRFFFNPELNEQVQIRPDGRLSLQLIGDVNFAGKTVSAVARDLEQLYAQELTTPRVSVQIRGYATQKVYVSGEVVRPGVVNMPGDMTLLHAIGEAGGIKTTGNVKSVVLIRKGLDGNPVWRKVAIRQAHKLTAEAGLLLRPFDVIIVPETKIAHLNRWVDQHIKQLNPGVAFGFNYLLNQGTASTVTPGFQPF